MDEFYGILPILATLVQLETAGLPDLVQCLPTFRQETCNIMFPKCDANCTAQLPCESSCRSLGPCQKWLDSKLLGSLVKGGEHYSIVETVTSDKVMLEIVEEIAKKFTSQCGAEGVYSSDTTGMDKCSDVRDLPVKQCKA